MHRRRLALILAAALVAAGCSRSDITVPFFLGRLTVEVRGLPAGTPARVTVTDPDGQVVDIAATRVFDLFRPGTYVVEAEMTIDHFGDYYPDGFARDVEVSRGEATSVAVTYSGLPVRGGLVVAAIGLPAAAAPHFAVRGPQGFAAEVTPSDTLTRLAPGDYEITATRLLDGETVYAPWPTSVPVVVAAGAYAVASVAYGLAYDVSLDLSIARVEFTQSTQRDDGTVPLIAGRDAVLRVYGLANEANEVAPAVLVEWYQNGVLSGSDRLTRAASFTPVEETRGDAGATWNVRLAGAVVRPGLGVRVVIDPDGEVPEALEANNTFPISGAFTPLVIERPVLGMRLVPIFQSTTGLQGSVRPATASGYAAVARQLLPVPDIDVDLRTVYTTSTPPLQADNANRAWHQILSELTTLRAAENAQGRHYYGVVQPEYTSGVAGIGRLPGFVALGWDRENSREMVLAHELGHNLGLYHVDCGGPDGVDPDYPHPGGLTGTWGFDLAAMAPKAPTENYDLMSYCRPQWISDYMYLQVLANNPAPALSTSAATDCLLVWGHLASGELVLEPSLVVSTVPSLPPETGPYRLVARDAAGNILLSSSFAMPAVGDLPAGDGVFAWALPLAAGKAAGLESVELRGPGSLARQERSAAGKSRRDPAIRAQRTGDLRLQWDTQAYPVLMARREGVVLGILRGGDAVLRASPGPLALTFSDGVVSMDLAIVAP